MKEKEKDHGKVLIVDDTVSIINMVKTTLLNKGYQVLIATSGQNAIKSAQLAQPDLILLDILMPEMDGYETCKRLKKDNKTKDIPVLFMSALTDVFDKVKAFKLGAVDYVTKPINVEELLARINTQVSLYKMQQKLIETNILLEEKVEERTKELKENQKKYKTVADFNYDWEYWILPNGNFEYISPSCQRITGYSPEELINSPNLLEDIIVEEDRHNWQEHVEQEYISDSKEIVFRIKTKNGDIKWIGHVCRPVHNENGELNGIRVSNRDINDRILADIDLKKKTLELKERYEELLAAEEEIRATNDELKENAERLIKSEKRYKDFVNLSHEGIYRFEFTKPLNVKLPLRKQISWSLENLFLAECNFEYAKLCGYKSPDELVGKSIIQLFNGEQRAYDFIANFIKSSYTWNNLESVEILPDGREKNILNNVFGIINNGQLNEIWGTQLDVTERKQADEDVKIEKDKAQMYLDMARVIFVALNNKGEVTLLNQKGCELLELLQEEAIGKDWFENFIPSKVRETVKESFDRLIDNNLEPDEYYENAVLTSTGKEKIIAWHNIALKNNNGDVIGSLSSGEDITERKYAEEAYRTLVDNSLQGLIIIQDEKIKFANTQIAEISGYSIDEILSFSLEEIYSVVHEEDRDWVLTKIYDLINGIDENLRLEFRYVRKDGTALWTETYSSLVRFRGRKALQVTYIDITKRKNAELAIEKSEQSLKKIIKASSGVKGQAYFDAMTMALEEATDATFSFIGEYVDNKHIKTISLSYKGKILENLTYELKNAPCNSAFCKESCFYPEDVTTLFPKYQLINDMEIEAYIDTPVFNHNNECIGIIVSLYDKPMTDTTFVKSVFEVFAGKIAGEIERLKAEQRMEESENRFKALFKNMQSGVAIYEPVKNGTDFRFIGINKAAEKITRIKEEKIIGSTFLKEYPNMKKTPLYKGLQEVYKTGVGKSIEPFYYKDEIREGWRENRIYKLPSGEMVAIFEDITEQKKAQEVLSKSEARFKRTFENNPNIMLLADIESMTILDVNKAYSKTLGYEKEEVVNIPGKFTFSLPNNKGKKDIIKNLLKLERVEGIEILLRNKREKKMIGLAFAEPIDAKEKRIYIISLIDITERKKAESELLNEKTRVTNILQGTNAGTWDWNIQTDEISIDARWAGIIGYVFEELKPINADFWYNSIHPDDKDKTDIVLKKHLSGDREYYEAEFRQRHKSGRWIWISARGKVIEWTKDGKPLRMYGTHMDISERKYVEEKLHTTQMHYTDFINYSSDEISYWKAPRGLKIYFPVESQIDMLYEAECIDANKTLANKYGYDSKDKVIGKKFRELIKARTNDIAFRVFVTNHYQLKDYEVYTESIKTGTLYGIDSWFGAVEQDELKYIWMVSKDITDRKNAELALRGSEERFKAFMNNSPFFAYIKDENLDHVYSNDLVLENSLEPKGIFQPEVNKLLEQADNEVLKKKIPYKELEYISKLGGKDRWLRDIKFPIKLPDNKVLVGGVAIDITEQKKYEKELEKHRNHLELLVKERTDELVVSNEELQEANEELSKRKVTLENIIEELNNTQAKVIQSEKMASLGVLVAGVAHEINNPVNFINSSLTGLKNNLEFLSGYTKLYNQLSENTTEVIKKIEEKEKEASVEEVLEMFKRSIEIIEVGIERTTKIVTGLKSFARSDEKKLEQYDVHESIDNTLLILYNQFKNRIEIEKDFGKIPQIECFPGQINQVVMNILNNAIQSIEDKGKITITTGLVAAKKVSIEIKDTGKGIPKEKLQNIFDPFFTTKPVGKGTGLGLSISYGIIKDHNGDITVNSIERKYTAFKILLPIKQK